jgi:hypothetical protein
MSITIQVKGLSALQLAFDMVRFRYNRGYKVGLQKAGEFLLQESLKITPIDTGFLRSTGSVSIRGDGFRAKADIGFGAYYAVWVHEDLTKYHAPPTTAKFITIPMNDKKNHDKVVRMIRAEMSKRT